MVSGGPEGLAPGCQSRVRRGWKPGKGESQPGFKKIDMILRCWEARTAQSHQRSAACTRGPRNGCGRLLRDSPRWGVKKRDSARLYQRPLKSLAICSMQGLKRISRWAGACLLVQIRASLWAMGDNALEARIMS